MNKAAYASLVALPTIITVPGEYITRCGEKVVIHRASKNQDHGCAGNYPNGTSDHWHRSGRIFFGQTSNNDIVRAASETYYIVPAMTDQAGHCRIVVKNGKIASARDDYRANPDSWHEAGLMNSQGDIVCFDGPRDVWDDLKSYEPLMAGGQFHYGA